MLNVGCSVISNSFVTPWTTACQAPLSKEFCRQEWWSGKAFPSLGHLPDPGTEPRSSILQADSLPSEPPGKHYNDYYFSRSGKAEENNFIKRKTTNELKYLE